MWFNRDLHPILGRIKALPVKVLKGPRQVGKTSLLERLGEREALYFDDLAVRRLAQDNPRLLLDQMRGPAILDEATLAPQLFPELKRRVDAHRRDPSQSRVDVWITGSNQTLLQRQVQESLSGRASYFDLNTLSIHELGSWSLQGMLLRGGWPQLHVDPDLDPVRYLNDLLATFVEKDIVTAAGIERREAFSRSLALLAGRIGQLLNASDLARNVGVDTTTVQSWISLLELNGLVRTLRVHASNLNQRLIKAPKLYFEDVGLATRLQGWREAMPLLASPSLGPLVENLAVAEVARFFGNRGESPRLSYLRSKEQVEIDLLIELPNQRFVAAEIKTTPQDWTPAQVKLLDSLRLDVVARWVLSPTPGPDLHHARVVAFSSIWEALDGLWG